MPKRYIVRLSEEEQQQLKDLVRAGKAAAYKIKHANLAKIAQRAKNVQVRFKPLLVMLLG